jgi:hypothetical protein
MRALPATFFQAHVTISSTDTFQVRECGDYCAFQVVRDNVECWGGPIGKQKIDVFQARKGTWSITYSG